MGPFGSKITKENYVPAGIPVVRGVNLARGIFVDDDFVFIEPQKADELISANVAPGDLIFTHRGTIGQVSMMPRRPRFDRYVIGSSQVKTRLDETVAVPEFYYYWFMSPEGQRSILANTSTVGVPGIATPLTSIKGLRVPLPPFPTQQAIAAVLKALDDKIAVNERISATSLDLNESLYLRASSSEDWSSIQIGSAARWHSGGTPKTSEPLFWNGDIPWISALSLKSCWIETSDRKLTELGAASGTRMVPAGVVIFVVRGSSLKEEFRIGLTQREVAFGQDCKALVPHPGLDPHILFHGIRSAREKVLDLVDETSIGAGRLSTDLITKLPIRVPPATSGDIVEKIHSLDEVSAQRTREGRALSVLRDMLLPELMSGRLRVKDAEKVAEEAI
jgi:type I restriction enzyme S subunit